MVFVRIEMQRRFKNAHVTTQAHWVATVRHERLHQIVENNFSKSMSI